MTKIDTLLATFTARYGKFVPKDGQLVDAVIQGWEAALGNYRETDIRAACASWMTSTKYARWPEPAELIEILKGFGARQEFGNQVAVTPRVASAANDASAWYTQLITSPLPSGAWPWRWEDAIAHVIGAAEARHKGKSFGWLLTHAWLQGDIPGNFDAKAKAFFADQMQRKELYLAAVKTSGAARVHEGRVPVTAMTSDTS